MGGIRFLSVLMILAMMTTLLPVAAAAADKTHDIEAGPIFIIDDGSYIIKGTTGTTTTNTITVAYGKSPTITLENVNIDNSIGCAFRIVDNSTGNVRIKLVGNNTLKSGNNYAGLQKNGSGDTIGSLTIEGTGSLTATGGYDAAGIGGGYRGDGSNITIYGGTVTAFGGYYAAGIGGGGCTGLGFGDVGDGSDITIHGGTVTATAGSFGAGIGGGYAGTGSNITINDGTVTATGSYGSVGIGGGDGGSGSNITINGGTVTAAGGSNSAGIGGGGNRGSGNNITINGGTVTATGGDGGAGIGGGGGGSGSDITINDGTVTANGGGNAAGIGGGAFGAGSDITIDGGKVTAFGGFYGGAGIGGGWGCSGSDITINDGTVTAFGGSYVGAGSAGIGGGYNGSGSNITITGGTVTADGGTGAAGIGAGGGAGGTASDNMISPAEGKQITVKAGATKPPETFVGVYTEPTPYTITYRHFLSYTQDLDFTALRAALDAANLNKESVSTSTDGTDIDKDTQWVTEAVMDAYNVAIAAAQAVATNSLATQAEIDAAVTNLANATDTFDAAKADGTKAELSDPVIPLAAPNIANIILAAEGVPANNVVGKGKESQRINFISEVARHMGPQTDFECNGELVPKAIWVGVEGAQIEAMNQDYWAAVLCCLNKLIDDNPWLGLDYFSYSYDDYVDDLKTF